MQLLTDVELVYLSLIKLQLNGILQSIDLQSALPSRKDN